MIAGKESVAVEFDHDWFALHAESRKENCDGGRALERVRLSVEGDSGHGIYSDDGTAMAEGSGARIALSQSFHTGSNPCARSWAATSAAVR